MRAGVRACGCMYVCEGIKGRRVSQCGRKGVCVCGVAWRRNKSKFRARKHGFVDRERKPHIVSAASRHGRRPLRRTDEGGRVAGAVDEADGGHGICWELSHLEGDPLTLLHLAHQLCIYREGNIKCISGVGE